MIYTSIIEADIRKAQYIESLVFYLRSTCLPIIFVENTGSDISDSFKEYIKMGRLEYLTFSGNNFDKSRGKGYGEAEIIEYAVGHSFLLQNANYIIKVTGRLKILNIISLINFHKWLLPACDIQCTLDVETGFADSRVFITTPGFLNYNFLMKKEMINDAEGVYFEHILFNSIYQRSSYVFFPLFLRPLVKGVSGTSGQPYWEGNYYRVKLAHLQKMLDYSIRYNFEYKNNASYMVCILLRIIRKCVWICNCFLGMIKK